MKSWTRLAAPILLALIVGLYSLFLLQNLTSYTWQYDTDYWSKVFSQSQLVKGDKANIFLSDAEVYAIVGYKYARGEDPTTIHAEVPPLGKYLIGASIIIFSNPQAILPFIGAVVLLLLYLLSLRVLGSKPAALLVVALFNLDPLFRSHLLTSSLEMTHLLFLLAAFLFFLRGLPASGQGPTQPRYFLLASASLGAMMATKVYVSGLAVLVILLAYLVLTWQVRALVYFFFSLVVLPLAYSAAWVVHLAQNPDPIAFARFQRWLTSWWAGAPQVPWGGFAKILLLGKWQTWWDKKEIIEVASWTPIWPAITAVSLLGSLMAFARREKKALLVVFWVAGYMLFLTPAATFPRHLLAILPGLYLLFVYAIMIGYEQAQRKIVKKYW